jgi:hypothetical protein
MPTLKVRSIGEVPSPSRSPKAVQEVQRKYEGYIREIDGNVGELELSPDEQVRSVKVRLRRAATRLGADVEIWDAEGRVYFTAATKRGRPRKSS